MRRGLRLLISIAVLLGVVVSVFWWRRDHLTEALIRSAIDKIQPSLPFIIDDFRLSIPWSRILSGDLGIASFRVHGTRWRAEGSGPLHWQSKRADYAPKVQVWVDESPWTEMPWKFSAQWTRVWQEPTRLEVSYEATEWHWPKRGARLKQPRLRVAWENDHLQVDALSENAGVSQDDSHAIEISKLRLEAQNPLTLKPFALGNGSLAVKAQGAEVLWGDFYADWTLSKQALKSSWETLEGTQIQKLNARFAPWLSAEWDPVRALAQVSVKRAPLAFLLASAESLLPSAARGLEARGGALNADLDFTLGGGEPALRTARFELDQAHLLAKPYSAEADQLRLRGRVVMSSREVSGSLAIGRGYYKRFELALEETPWRLSWGGPGGVSIETPVAEVPLRVKGLPMQVGALKGDARTGFHFDSSGKNVELEKILRGLCVQGRLPPARVTWKFKPVEIASRWIDPDGIVTIDAFGGEVKLSEMALWDYSLEVPELDFTADWSRIDLAKLADWLGYGEMDGWLQGYAHDVTFQSWLPTLYDVRIEAVPHQHSDIVFSPDAMKNTIKLFAGEDIDHLPGFANWLAFGWPSRVFGGYDVHYFGMSLFAREGSIVVETLDPAKVVETERKHFFLYGPRFKIPLNSSRYPLVVDQTAMSNFARHMWTQFGSIAKSKADATEEKDEACLPPGLLE